MYCVTIKLVHNYDHNQNYYMILILWFNHCLLLLCHCYYTTILTDYDLLTFTDHDKKLQSNCVSVVVYLEQLYQEDRLHNIIYPDSPLYPRQQGCYN